MKRELKKITGGSKKQITWAIEIRAKAISDLEELMTHEGADVAAGERIFDVLYTATQAQQFIDRRDLLKVPDLMQSLKLADPPSDGYEQ